MEPRCWTPGGVDDGGGAKLEADEDVDPKDADAEGVLVTGSRANCDVIDEGDGKDDVDVKDAAEIDDHDVNDFECDADVEAPERDEADV